MEEARSLGSYDPGFEGRNAVWEVNWYDLSCSSKAEELA
jgi:hypothetical protein